MLEKIKKNLESIEGGAYHVSLTVNPPINQAKHIAQQALETLDNIMSEYVLVKISDVPHNLSELPIREGESLECCHLPMHSSPIKVHMDRFIGLSNVAKILHKAIKAHGEKT